jgi:hypothetical protein
MSRSSPTPKDVPPPLRDTLGLGLAVGLLDGLLLLEGPGLGLRELLPALLVVRELLGRLEVRATRGAGAGEAPVLGLTADAAGEVLSLGGLVVER